jgi:zinc finger SWIM domain-containing protein 3
MAACARSLGGNNTYAVAIVRANGDLSSEQERIVYGNSLEQRASCNCEQFTWTGVLCAHALKVLDLMNIKLLPDHYILKRWTREARYGTIHDNKGRSIIENPKLDAMLRYRYLSHKFLILAYQAASSLECCSVIDSTLDSLGKQLEDKISASRSILSESCTAQPNVQQGDDLLSAARLKKKRCPTKKFEAT